MNRWFALIPIVVLLAVGVFLMVQLNTLSGAPGPGRSYQPDALLGQTIPLTVLPIRDDLGARRPMTHGGDHILAHAKPCNCVFP